MTDQKIIIPAEYGSNVTQDGEPIIPANQGVPTQVANPKRASWRTYVQSVVGFLVGANIVLPILQTYLASNPDLVDVLGPVYGWVVIGVNFGILVLGLLAKLVALLMANATVNDWITKHLPFLAPIKP